MFKVMVTTVVNVYGSPHSSVNVTVLEFDDRDEAQVATSIINNASPTHLTQQIARCLF